jgi:FtsZ-interacting cell division protein ZipA
MAKKISALFIALLIMGFTVAGCGSDNKKSDSGSSSDTAAKTTSDDSSSSDASKGAAKTTGDDSSSSDSSSADTTKTPDVSNNPQVKQAIAQCKTSVDAAPQLKPDTKKKLESICEKAASGDESGIKKASKEVCLAIINDTGISGPAADTAKQQCSTIGQ